MNIVAQADMLRAKQWVVIRRKETEQETDEFGELWKRAAYARKARWIGPYKIVETELPLLVVEIEGRREMLHVSDYEFSIVSQKLARALYADLWGPRDVVQMANGSTIHIGRSDGSGRRRRQKKEKPSEATCPVCQYPRRRRKLLKIDGVLREVWYCPECGKNGNTVSQL